jgi:hypothetical protein
MGTNRMTPVPDNPAGPNIPYRGVVDHGVPYAEVESTDEAHYHMGRPVEYTDEPAEDVVPIPVRVVTAGAREKRYISHAVYSLDAGAGSLRIQIAQRDENRTNLLIRNVGGSGSNQIADMIFIGNENVSEFSGYALLVFGEVQLKTTEAVYAYKAAAAFPNFPADSGFPVIVTVLSEITERIG